MAIVLRTQNSHLINYFLLLIFYLQQDFVVLAVYLKTFSCRYYFVPKISSSKQIPKSSSKATSKSTSSSLGSSSKLTIRTITFDYEDKLSEALYELEKFNIIFPFFDKKKASLLMSKHIWAQETSVISNPEDGVESCELADIIHLKY